MRAHGLGGEKLRQSPLDVDALIGVGIVGTPKLREIFQHLVVHPAAAPRAKHHGQVGILVVDAGEDMINTADVVDVEIALIGLVVGREDIGHDAVAVPLEVGHVGILRHDTIDDAEDVVLHLRVGDVKHQLVAMVVGLAVGLHDGPVGMLLKQLTLRIDHLRLYPDAKLHLPSWRL